MPSCVVSSAEVAYKRHSADKGIQTLIQWFRAELREQPDAIQIRHTAHADNMLEKYQEQAEQLALDWRQKRIKKQAASAA